MPEFEKRKIFISWSKQPTDRVASALKSLLLHMFDNISPFVSKETIEYGTLSIPEIFKALSGSDFGFLIVTTKNQSEPWLNFEAGALAKSIAEDGDTRVVPLLIDFDSVGQLSPGPIANLQAQVVTEQSLLDVIKMMARYLSVDAATVLARWPAAWTEFDAVLSDVRTSLDEADPRPGKHDRSTEEMLEELLALTRGQVRRQSTAPASSWAGAGIVDSDGNRLSERLWSVQGIAPIAVQLKGNRARVVLPSETHYDSLLALRSLLREAAFDFDISIDVVTPADGLLLSVSREGGVTGPGSEPGA